MPIRWTLCSALLFAAAVGVRERPLSAQSTPANRYFVKDLGTLGGGDSQAFAINESGQTAGAAQRADAATHAFLYSGTALKDLGTLGGAGSVAAGVNRSGQVVGHALTPLANSRAFLYANGSLRSLGTLGGSQSAAYAINGVGDIVGSASTAGDAATRAFLYRSGVMTRLGATFGGTNSVATAINEGGEVAGYASTAGNASTRAFLFTGGAQINLGTLGAASEAWGVNNGAEVVGRSVLASGARHAFVYSGGAMRDLGTLGGSNSEALAINDSSQIVGSSEVAGAAGTHAFLYQNGAITDLNTLLPAGSGWVLEAGTAINSVGEIAGYGTIGGHRHAFRLTPSTAVGLFEGGALTQEDSNIPRFGVEVGRTVTFVTSILVDDGAARNVVFTDTMSGPIQIQSIRTYQGIASCQSVQNTVTCRIPAMGANTFPEDEIWVTVRVAGPGSFGHTARVTADNADGFATLSEDNIAIALESFTLSANTVAGGKAVLGTLSLTSLPPPGDALVHIVSSNPAVAAVPAGLDVQRPTSTRNFNIIPAVVSQPTSVTISATYGLVTISRTLTVVPPAVAALSLTRSTIVGGCQTATAKVTLTGSAPAAGAAVRIVATSSGVVTPSAVTVPAGATGTSFTVSGRIVHAVAAGTFTASYGGASKSLALSVRPIFLTGVTLAASAIRGGSGVGGTATIECAAPTGGITGTLASTNPVVAAPMSSSLTFVAGATTRRFSVRTTKVTTTTDVTIKASLNGVTKNVVVTVKP